MLKEKIENGYGKNEDYNCSEKILNLGNEVYNLNINKEGLRVASAFGGGMGIGSVCGVVTGALMVVSSKCATDVAHKCPQVKELSKQYINRFNEELGSLNCDELKEKHFDSNTKCLKIITIGAQILEEMLSNDDK